MKFIYGTGNIGKVKQVKEYASKENARVVSLCAKVEEDLSIINFVLFIGQISFPLFFKIISIFSGKKSIFFSLYV